MLYRIIRSDPWYADIVNFMVKGHVPPGGDIRKLKYESRQDYCDPPYLFRICTNGILRRCVPADEGISIIEKYHSAS